MSKRKSKIAEKRQKRQKVAEEQDLAPGLFSRNTKEDDWDDVEQDYELVPRVVEQHDVVERLPVKKAGKIERVIAESVKEEDEPVLSEPEAASDENDDNDSDAHTEKEDEPNPLTSAEQLQLIKEEIADLASKLMEDPEENIECLGKLRKLAELSNFATSQLAILALVPVFKAMAPGYKIRPLSEAEKRERTSKEVARVRKFEQSLVMNYHLYVELLGKLARVLALNSENNKKVTQKQIKQGQSAAKAACELCLSSLRYFNYRAELFTIPIRRLNKIPRDGADLEIFTTCLRTLETLLKGDKEHGAITVDLVGIMCKIIKDKKFRVDEAVINVFLSLSLLDDYDPHSTKQSGTTRKLKKKDRVHLSKKQRKARKEMKEIEEEMRKAEQSITAEERERFQAQTLKMVLTLYLEILKAGSNEVEEQSSAKLLTAAVMEGLSKFGRMSNFDLLGDFLEVLREILSNIVSEHSLAADDDSAKDSTTGGSMSNHEVRNFLLCVTAAFALFLNHGEVGRLPISVDLTTFISNLYTMLAEVSLDSDLEFSHKSLRLADPLSDSALPHKPAVNVSTNAELLLKSLDLIFFRSKNGSLARAMPFTKRLYISALHTPEKSTIATLKFISKLVGRYGDGLKSLWSTDETISGEGSYVLGTEKEGFEVDLERSNIGSAVLWENTLLDKHYCNIIKDGSRSLMKNSKEKAR